MAKKKFKKNQNKGNGEEQDGESEATVDDSDRSLFDKLLDSAISLTIQEIFRYLSAEQARLLNWQASPPLRAHGHALGGVAVH